MFIPGVRKLFGVEGRMSPQGTCCGPDRWILREKFNNCGLAQAHPPHHDVMSDLQKHWEEIFGILFRIVTPPVFSFILFFQLGMLISFFSRNRFSFWKNRFFFDYRILVLCVAHSRPTDAAVTLCARPYIAAARERTPDVRNGIRGIGSADGMRSL